MRPWKYIYRALTEPPKSVSPLFNYATLSFTLLLLAWFIYLRSNLAPDYAGDRYGSAVVGLTILFNLLAFRFRWPSLATLLLRALAIIWYVFATVYITSRSLHIALHNG